MSDRAVILLVEDNEDDVLLIRNAFSYARINNPLFIVRDGDEAIDYLRGEGKYRNRAEYPLPDLILLDLKMPRRNGLEVLSWIRRQPGLSRLRVLMLTSSDQMSDINLAYTLGANSFLVKPNDFENLVGLTRSFQDFWLNASRAPEISRPPRQPKKTEE